MAVSQNSYGRAYSFFRFLGLVDVESLRKDVLPKLRGKILDIGVGDGGNFRHYSDSAFVTVLDRDTEMLSFAKQTVSHERVKNYRFICADAKDMSMIPSNSFDVLVAVFIYSCSVPDPIAALGEAKRVLRKGGEAFIVAHIPSKNPIVCFVQDIVLRIIDNIAGPESNSEVLPDVKKAGFEVIEERSLGRFGICWLYRVRKD